MSPAFVPVVAHSWGWDEILLFAVPILLALGAVRLAERRAAERREAEGAAGGPETEAEDDGTTARSGDQDAGGSR